MQALKFRALKDDYGDLAITVKKRKIVFQPCILELKFADISTPINDFLLNDIVHVGGDLFNTSEKR